MNAAAACQTEGEPTVVSLGKLFRDARKRKALSPQQVAEAADVNVNSLMKYERAGEAGGVYPPFDKAARLCAVLDVDPRDVFAEVVGGDDMAASFYRDRASGRVDQAAVDSDLTRARELLAEATKLLRRRGGELPREEAPEALAGEPVRGRRQEEPRDYESGIENLSEIAREHGIGSRAVNAELIEFRQHVLKPMEYDELYNYAMERGIDLAGIPEPDAQHELPPKERARLEDALESYLLCDAIYGEAWRNLDSKGFERAANYIRDNCYDGRSFVADGWDSGAKRLARLRREISPHLVCAIETRAAVTLGEGKPANGDSRKRGGNTLSD